MTQLTKKSIGLLACLLPVAVLGSSLSQPAHSQNNGGNTTSTYSEIGDVKVSMLLEPQLQALPGGKGWVLADGRNVQGSRFAIITGMTSVPDLRGVFLRGKNYSRIRQSGNADGDLPIGAFQSNQNAAHSHGYTFMKYDNAVDGVDSCCKFSGEHHNESGQTAASGGNEARPNAVTVNYFIKIN